MGNNVDENFLPLYIGVDDGNLKDEPVLAVFARNRDGSYILKREFEGDRARKVYDYLIGRGEVDADAITNSSV